MSLAGDFLRQSRDLATRRGRPSQINLRRSVSAAYYAVFHLLIAEAVASLVPDRPRSLRARVARSFSHGELKEHCRVLQLGTPPKNLQPLYGTTISPALRAICYGFLTLIDARHQADYDISHQLDQASALLQVELAEAIFRQWRNIRGAAETNVFLCQLAFGKRWDK